MGLNFKKMKTNLNLLWDSLFHGMEGGAEVLEGKASGSDYGSEVIRQKEVDSVMNDLLRGEKTQRVKETVDELYRTLNASENLSVNVIGGNENDGYVLKVRKKTAADYGLKINVFNPENLPIRLIQDNKHYDLHNLQYVEDITKIVEGEDSVSIFNIERNGFMPRFKLERYINKIVIRNKDKNSVFIDMYTTEYASQFGKVDALFIKQIYDIKEKNNKKSDITTIDKLSFITDKSYGENSLYHFSYDNIIFQYINVFDGNFVLTFTANIVDDGTFIGKKYETKELSEKLKKHQKRDNVKGIDAETLMRHIKQEENNEVPDYGTVVFKLNENEENSN